MAHRWAKRAASLLGAGAACVITQGCGEPPDEEPSGEVSDSVTVSQTREVEDLLTAVRAKTRRCEPLTSGEIKQLWTLDGTLKKSTFEAFVFLKCTMGPDTKVASATVSVINRGGFSSTDGVFGDLVLQTSVQAQIPLRFVTLSGAVVGSDSYRSTSEVTFDRRTTSSVVGGVRLDAVAGSLTGNVALGDDGKTTVSMTLQSAAITVPISVCTAPAGKASVGASLSISAPTNGAFIRGEIARVLRIDGTNKGLLASAMTRAQCEKSRPYADTR